MSDEPPTSDATSAQCGDVSTWLHNRERVDAFSLGTLVQQNGGTKGLDLHGANLVDVDLSPEMIAKLAAETRLEYFVFWGFRKHAELRGAHLECASLWNANLAGVDFHEAHMEGARLTGARLDGASFERAHLHHADLSSAHLNSANLQHANMQGADLYRAQLQKADLKWAQLQGAEPMWADFEGADFWAARLDGADLTGAQLRGARFTNVTLRRARLRQAQLQNADFYYANSLDGVHWYAAFLDRTRMSRHQLGEAIGDEQKARILNTGDAYQEAMEAYLILKNNFNSIGRYGDAAWAHVKEQRMERAALRRELDWRRLRTPAFSTTLGSWLLNLLWDKLTGYGETPQKPLLWAGGLAAILFPLLYWAIGAREDHARGFTSWSPSDIDWAGWGDSVVFSLASFGTLSFTQLQPDGTLPTVIAAFEAFIGVLLFALFVFTLGNRMSRS